MAFKDIMNRVRHWDNLTAKWLMRHFYFTFSQIALFIIFLFWFVNMFHVIDTTHVPKTSLLERIQMAQSVNITIIVFLMILNSFWLLFVFNSIQRLHILLKDMSFHLSRLRNRNKNQDRY